MKNRRLIFLDMDGTLMMPGKRPHIFLDLSSLFSHFPQKNTPYP